MTSFAADVFGVSTSDCLVGSSLTRTYGMSSDRSKHG